MIGATRIGQLANRVGDAFSVNSDRQIVNAISKVYGLKVAGAGLAYIVQVTVAMILGASNYGIFALAWTIATMLGQLCCCGFNDTVGRFLPAYILNGDLPRARGFVGFILRFTTVVSIIVTAVLILAFVLARDLLPDGYMLPIVLGLLCVPFLSHTHLKESIAINRSTVIRGLFPSYVLRPLLLILFTIVIAKLTGIENSPVAVAGLFLAAVFAAILQSWLLAKPLANELQTGPVVYEKSNWVRTSMPLLLAQGFFVLTTNIDVVILSHFVSSAQLGIYFAAVKIATLLSFVHIAVASGLTRRLSESFAQNDLRAFDEHFRRGRLWMLLPTVPGAIFLYFGSSFLLGMFGAEFVIGTNVVLLLTGGVLIQALGGPVQESLIVSGSQKAVSTILGISFLLNIILSISLVTSLGMIGVAIASTLSITARIGAMTVLKRWRRNDIVEKLQAADSS